MAPSKKRKQKKKLTTEQKSARAYVREIRKIFKNVGISRLADISDKQLLFKSTQSDLDDVFVHKNVIICTEYTSSKSANISSHLKGKKVFFDKVTANPAEFVEFLKGESNQFRDVHGDLHSSQYKAVILYSSRNEVDDYLKNQMPSVKYFDYSIMKYFQSVAQSVKHSAKNELLHFLGFSKSDIKSGAATSGNTLYAGSVLPEAHSNFEDGFKVVSFYVDPAALLARSYVLRKDGWRDEVGLYQRMISKGKIESIRKHLGDKKRVFINNIVVTLPPETKILDRKNDTVNFSKITETSPANISLPDEFNSIGIIDGQHRVFSYHEGGTNDDEIRKLRERQNLLVTGVIYPETLSSIKKAKFEAQLFLEINSNQTNAKSDLKQAIGLLTAPFSPLSVARLVVQALNRNGPLKGHFERYFFDTDKIKTTSIVSYGLRPLVKLHGDDSLFSQWNNADKNELEKGDKDDLLETYVKFCADEINKFLVAAKLNIDQARWTPAKSVEGRLLTTTVINGFIICLREIILNDKVRTQEYYSMHLKELYQFEFSSYHSSQYGRMGQDLFARYFYSD